MKSNKWYFTEAGYPTEECKVLATMMTESIKRIFADMIGMRPQFVYCGIDPSDCTWNIIYCLPVDLPAEFYAKGREPAITKLCQDIAAEMKKAFPEERITRMRLGKSALVHDIDIQLFGTL